MKKHLICILLLSLSFASIANTYSFVGANFPLIVEQTADGTIQGLGVDIAKDIMQKLGHELVIEILPLKRALKRIENGQADIIIGPYKSPEREKFMLYSEISFYRDQMVFYTRKDSTVTWNGNFDSLQHSPIGVIRGWSYGNEFNQYKNKLNITTVQSVAVNFKMLLIGRIDLCATNIRNAIIINNDLNIANKVKILQPAIQTSEGYFGFSKKRNLNTLYKRFNQELHKMVEQGEIAVLEKKYNLNVFDEL